MSEKFSLDSSVTILRFTIYYLFTILVLGYFSFASCIPTLRHFLMKKVSVLMIPNYSVAPEVD